MSALELHLAIDPSEARPIWKQIEEGLTDAIAAGRLVSGEPIPSVRELARRLRVNPATIARAYQSLAAAGLVEMRRGEGTFVAAEPPALSGQERRERLVEAAGRLAALATLLGVDRSETIAALDEALESRQPRKKVVVR